MMESSEFNASLDHVIINLLASFFGKDFHLQYDYFHYGFLIKNSVVDEDFNNSC